MTSQIPRSTGVVLLSVLLIVALLSAVTVRLVSRHSLHVAQTSNTLGTDLTLNYAIGAETFARQLLHEDWKADGGEVDHLEDIWATPLQPFPLEEYANAFMEIQLKDLGSCFNLNSVESGGPSESAAAPRPGNPAQASPNLQSLRRLLTSLELPETIADAWSDWIDPDDRVDGNGAEDSEYQLEEPAYRTANQLATDISEIRLLANLDPEHLEKLLPFVCVLPTTKLSVNVNTASAEVLSALQTGPVPINENSNNSNRSRAESIVYPPIQLEDSLRTYTAPTEFTAEHGDLGGAIDQLAVNSIYYEVQARVQIDGNVTELSSILHREVGTGAMRVVSRNLGKKFQSRLVISTD